LSLRRADIRFALPRPVRSAVVLGDMPAWEDGLREAGIEAASPTRGQAPQLVVAPARLAAQALALTPELLVLENGAPRILDRQEWSMRVLLLLPDRDHPELLLPAGAGDAVRYAVRHWRGATTAATRARNLVARELLARGVVPPGRAATTVAARTGGPPFLVAAALEALPVGDVRWFAAFGPWAHAFSRGAFYLFPPEEAEPAWVLKFARVTGLRGLFDKDEEGLRVAERAGSVVDVDADHVVAAFGKARAGHETDVAGPNHTEARHQILIRA
jgi:hypothetical protein